MVAEVASFSAEPHPCNAVAIDPSGRAIATASDDAVVRLFDVEKRELAAQMTGHADAAQCVAFDRKGKFLLSGSSDTTWRMWC